MAEFELWTVGRASKAIFATAAGIALVGAAFGLAKWSDNYHSPDLTPEKAFARMRELAGPGAVDCGRIAVDDDPSASLRCLENAMRERRPYWIVRENSFSPNVAMEFHWLGYTRSAQGRQTLVIYYPPDAYGTGAPGTLQIEPCHRIQSRLDSGQPGPTCIAYMDGKRYQVPPHWYRRPLRRSAATRE